ncbi:ABC transporter G family member 28 [Sesamum angolense]|uniref:ABC transporter G family member 28 n=1 Tax=Sesamum angolense TaxID=2727404 RepID=A0AAE1XCQ5_9LAMI|nr:ABC transporter G family member 28 [Sesamum angolense]
MKLSPATITFIFLLGASSVSHAAPGDGTPGTPVNPAAMELLSQALFSRFSNFSSYFGPEISKVLGFCISDIDAEWNAAFNFSKNTDFLAGCLRTNKDAMQRLCTAAEAKFYGASLLQNAAGGSAQTKNFLKPNKNCNLSSWPSGCESGWACSAGQDKKVDLKESKEMPQRDLDCRPCCEGFFCPRGLTCMIPCPLGSYCPQAKLNSSTGVCDPYRYQLPPGQPNHTCGGADIWSDFTSGPELFCSAGSYCPSTTQKLACTKGHYCRAGSTAQTSCYQLATCEPQTANQNITAYGIMFFAGITLVLMIIYNCSGQVLHTREKRQAKSREAAARSARETFQAREKWKAAKEVAKKGASELQSQLSRTFSRKKSVAPDHPRGSGQPKPGSDAALPPAPPAPPDSKGKKNKENNLTKMMRDIEENPDNDDGFDIQIGDKNLKKHGAKAKQLHTRSQIFKYAYGQIEKEKALQEQNNNLTFSGVISMATDLEFISRRPIEVFFQDLTLTLRGKNKHLLRCVTGKLLPGHVSAVMGPSGAGKTTFLSALTGKATGCTITGSILINGNNEPMQSYKKIIGYVPQDDIVHGNLTVEENLWFSARCRLPADLDKPEKVLVVERVIESLGLQAVRDSLVGTVEQRGISGGQRKRVNVGLEMVMEPSLLILDEPTSGLDSSSSLLLLRALRREALEGVNICMVVHQPSYTLFKMFDDLILLAKGGLTVYHGSVKKVEEYFAGIGINVPERVNPPDYFIDILEGIVKPPAGAAVKFNELPLRWMLHNGYAVPPDMLDSAGMASPAPGGSTPGASPAAKAVEEISFAGDLWQDVKFAVGQKADQILHNFTKSADLSERQTPSILQQYKYFLGRVGKQRLREARIQAVDYLILLLAGICLGTLAKVSDETFGSTGYLYTVIAVYTSSQNILHALWVLKSDMYGIVFVALLSKIAALRSFSLDKLHYWRESASGMSSLAYFLAKDTIDHFNTIVKPAWSVLLPVVLTLVANQEGDSFITKVADFCYTKWALEAFLLTNAERFDATTLNTTATIKQKHPPRKLNFEEKNMKKNEFELAYDQKPSYQFCLTAAVPSAGTLEYGLFKDVVH